MAKATAMTALSDRALRVALLGYVPEDDQHVIADMQWRIEELTAALDLALSYLAPRERGDSRAVSNEFVSMAAILSGGEANLEALSIVKAALAAQPQ